MRVGWPEIADLSFPDEDITDWFVDGAGRQLRVTLSGGWLDSAGGSLGRTIILAIGPWSSASEVWHPARSQALVCPSEPLKDICECGFGPDSVWLAGFAAASGDWVRYEFVGQACAEWQQEAEPGTTADGGA